MVRESSNRSSKRAQNKSAKHKPLLPLIEVTAAGIAQHAETKQQNAISPSKNDLTHISPVESADIDNEDENTEAHLKRDSKPNTEKVSPKPEMPAKKRDEVYGSLAQLDITDPEEQNTPSAGAPLKPFAPPVKSMPNVVLQPSPIITTSSTGSRRGRKSSNKSPYGGAAQPTIDSPPIFTTEPADTFFAEKNDAANDSVELSEDAADGKQPMLQDNVGPELGKLNNAELMLRREKERKRKKSTRKKRVKRQLESFVRRLETKWTPELCQQLFNEDDLIELCYRTYASLMRDPPLVDVPAPVNVCGDIHGQFTDLRAILREVGYPPEQRYVFLGDYVDRGPYSLEVLVMLFSLRLLYPKSVTLLRGNHEASDVNVEYGFLREVRMRYSIALYDTIQSVFRVMPFGALVEGRVLCVHGGISEDILNLDQIRKINRPCRIPEIGITCDLTWSDPSAEVIGYQKNPRGASKVFGPDAALAFCEKVGVDYIVRAHQVPNEGYEILPGNRVVTVFSAMRYVNAMDNNSAVLHIRRVYQETLLFSFTVFAGSTPTKVSKGSKAAKSSKLTEKKDRKSKKDTKKTDLCA